MEKLLIFGKWDPTEVVVKDPGLKNYINLRPIFVPHTHGRHAREYMGKVKLNIVERLINNLMRTEKYTGKKSKAYKMVKLAFEYINKKTKKNPIQVLVDAIQNASPREDITRLKLGGIYVPKAVDVSPSRRVDVALRNMVVGAMNKTFRNPKPFYVLLAEEIMAAARGDPSSYAVSKKLEVERIAESSR